MPCPHYSISVVSRGSGQSVMAAASYCLGQKLYSEHDGEWKYPHSSPQRVRYTEVMLPPNAPAEYADRQTLWNAVDAAEKRADAQTARRFVITLPKELTYEQNLALIRAYCQEQFVDKGMVCDLYYHDEHDGNPHVHLLLTMRAMDEQGRWLPKTKTTFVLDENGERIRGKNGRWLRDRQNTVDWSNPQNGEIWRHEWEVAQNNALEAAGRTERVDMRSFERQGIVDLEPQVHLGPAVSALESKGVQTNLGERNRQIIHVNSIIKALQRTVAALTEWLHSITDTLRQHAVLSDPGDYQLWDVLMSYLDLRKAARETWSHRAQSKGSLKDMEALHNAVYFLRERGIDTVNALAAYLQKTGARLSELRSTIRQKEQRIRDIDALLAADHTVNGLHPLQDELNSIHWKGRKEKFAADHKDELEKLNKAKSLLHKFGLTLPLDRKALRKEKKQISAEVEAERPKLETLQAELDQLKQVRYWVRKVIPDALPVKASDGGRSIREELDEGRNESELQDLLDKSARQVLQKQQDEPVSVLKFERH